MKALYQSLWKQKLLVPLLQDVSLLVPEPKFKAWPAYKVSLQSPINDSISSKNFNSTSSEHTFKVLNSPKILPCGMKKYLIRDEYEYIRRLLINAEAAKWVGGGDTTGNFDMYMNLDYKVSGQPGGGM